MLIAWIRGKGEWSLRRLPQLLAPSVFGVRQEGEGNRDIYASGGVGAILCFTGVLSVSANAEIVSLLVM